MSTTQTTNARRFELTKSPRSGCQFGNLTPALSCFLGSHSLPGNLGLDQTYACTFVPGSNPPSDSVYHLPFQQVDGFALQCSNVNRTFDLGQNNGYANSGLSTSSLNYDIGILDLNNSADPGNSNIRSLADYELAEMGYELSNSHQSIDTYRPITFSTAQLSTLARRQLSRRAPLAISRPSNSTNVTDTYRLRCPKESHQTFRRSGDYRRHMKKHEFPEFRCISMDCDKKFYRLDKLRNHVKVHGFNL